MSKLLPAAALAVMLMGLTAVAETKIAIINMERVFQGYYKTAKSEAVLKGEEATVQAKVKSDVAALEELKKQRDQLQEKALNIGLSAEVRGENRQQADARDAEFQEKKGELQQFMRAKEREFKKRYMDLRNDLVKELNAFMSDYALRQGYDLVLDSSGMSTNMIPMVVHSSDKLDVTEVVLGELNAGHEVSAK